MDRRVLSGVAESRRVDPRQLGVRGSRHGPPDPPVYILATLWFTDTTSRAWAFGAISGLGRHRARRGPVGSVRPDHDRDQLAGRVRVPGARRRDDRAPEPRPADPLPADPSRPFDGIGAVLSAVGMFFVVFGILQAGTNNALFVVCPVVGLVFLAGFYLYIRRRERAGKEPLLSTGLFRNRTCNLALVTQNIQWLLLMGISFVVSVFLQEVRGYNAIQTGVVFTAATVDILLSSFAQQRLAKKFTQRTLIIAGFVVTLAGILLLPGFVHTSSRVVAFVPGLFLIGLGVGAMLTPSVNVVRQLPRNSGQISGLSRAISNPARPSAPRSPARSSSPSSPRYPPPTRSR
jgi:hypothetical protein